MHWEINIVLQLFCLVFNRPFNANYKSLNNKYMLMLFYTIALLSDGDNHTPTCLVFTCTIL